MPLSRARAHLDMYVRSDTRQRCQIESIESKTGGNFWTRLPTRAVISRHLSITRCRTVMRARTCLHGSGQHLGMSRGTSRVPTCLFSASRSPQGTPLRFVRSVTRVSRYWSSIFDRRSAVFRRNRKSIAHGDVTAGRHRAAAAAAAAAQSLKLHDERHGDRLHDE